MELTRNKLIFERASLTVGGAPKARTRELPKSRLGSSRRNAEEKVQRRVIDAVSTARSRHRATYERRGAELFQGRLKRTPLRFRGIGRLR